MTIPHIISFVHDGMIFYCTRESCDDLNMIGFYFDCNGKCRPIDSESVYGEIVLNHIQTLKEGFQNV